MALKRFNFGDLLAFFPVEMELADAIAVISCGKLSHLE
jgi:hypothetical protein